MKVCWYIPIVNSSSFSVCLYCVQLSDQLPVSGKQEYIIQIYCFEIQISVMFSAYFMKADLYHSATCVWSMHRRLQS